MRAAFVTLGCKVNQYESNALAQLLRESGFIVSAADEEADVYIINSCTVTAESSRKSRQALRRIRQRSAGYAGKTRPGAHTANSPPAV